MDSIVELEARIKELEEERDGLRAMCYAIVISSRRYMTVSTYPHNMKQEETRIVLNGFLYPWESGKL